VRSVAGDAGGAPPETTLEKKFDAGAAAVGAAVRGLYGSLDRLGFESGGEFAVALSRARERRIPVLLADRDVDETLRSLARAVRRTSFGDLGRLEARLEAAVLDAPSIAVDSAASIAAAVEIIKQRETVEAIVAALRDATPALYSALVDERDAVMAGRLLAVLDGAVEDLVAQPQSVVCVVGMAHEDGIARRLTAHGFREARPSSSVRGAGLLPPVGGGPPPQQTAAPTLLKAARP